MRKCAYICIQVYTILFIMRTVEKASERAMNWIKQKGGVVRSKEAISSGIYARTLTNLVRSKRLELVARGVYRLKSMQSQSNPDLVTTALSIRSGVICLISSLSFHRLTTQIPHEVSIALPEKSRTPRLSYPPIKVYRFRGKAYEEGIEKHNVDGVMVKIYNPEKTLADCFKFRNKIGLDVFLEALKKYRSLQRINTERLLKYARICRVEKQIRPYLEAII